MNERQNRTIICSVLFLDLVEYSRKPVAEQMKLKERFNLLLREALRGVAPNDRIVLDTGDGAAVTFLGDPEDALFMALALRDAIVAEPEPNGLRLRSGINLGPVKLIKDLNGRPNIIGDGINVAQRIMGFCDPGQVLVSRSYYEVVSRLSDDYSQLFRDEGSRTDKHVREHQVYGINADCPTPDAWTATRSGGIAELVRRNPALAGALDFLRRILEPLQTRPRAATAFLAAAVLMLGGLVRANREPAPAPMAERVPAIQQVSATLPAQAADVQPKQAALPPQAPEAGEPQSVAGAPERAAERPAAARPAPPPKKVAAVRKAARAPEQSAENDSLATVSLAVLPWGEVYVDGRQQGVTPPTRSLGLAPGRHEIEFRNTTFPSHVEVIEVKAGEKVTLRHKFQETPK